MVTVTVSPTRWQCHQTRLGLVTLSPCRTLQHVIQTQKCVLCREYAKPNRCVFKCFAKVSKLKEEDLKPTGKTFQLLGPATAKDLKPQSQFDDREGQIFPWESYFNFFHGISKISKSQCYLAPNWFFSRGRSNALLKGDRTLPNPNI